MKDEINLSTAEQLTMEVGATLAATQAQLPFVRWEVSQFKSTGLLDFDKAMPTPLGGLRRL